MWTLFRDMHSGGSLKEPPYNKIYIEAENEDNAKVIFYNKFHHNPERVTCTCCGEDYSINSNESLEQLTNYSNSRYMTLEKYLQKEDVLVIYAKDIKPEERTGNIPTQGYVWI